MDSSHYESQDKDNINQKSKPIFSSHDTLFAYMSIIIGILLAKAFPITKNSLGATLMIFVMFSFGMIYMCISQIRLTKGLIIFAACIMLMSLGFVSGANDLIRVFLFIFIVCAFFYWCYCAFHLNGSLLLDENCVLHAINAIFVIVPSSLAFLFPALVASDTKNRGGKILRVLLWSLVGLICAIIPTAIVILLLSYDSQFTSLLKSIFAFSPLSVVLWVLDIIFGIAIALLLFGALFGAKHRTSAHSDNGTSLKKPKLHILPRALLCATVSPILVVYVIFFSSQWNYYVSAFTKVLPDGLTYAEYARSEFFQLCWVCVINAVILLLFNILIKKNDKKRDILRSVYSAIISLFTLVLVATALSKMLLYISSFGLTRKRVYAAWLIILLALFFIIVLLKQFIDRIPLIRSLVLTFVICFALIAIPNTDAMIASYNVEQYISGEVNYVDVGSLSEYEESAVPALAKLKEHLEEKQSHSDAERTLLNQTNATLISIKAGIDDEPTHVFSFNIAMQKARSVLKEIK